MPLKDDWQNGDTFTPAAANAVADAVNNFSLSNTYSATVGNGSSTSITVTHNLGTIDVVVDVSKVSTGAVVTCDVFKLTGNTVQLDFAVAPASNSIRVVIVGTAFGVGFSNPTASTSITDSTTFGRGLLTSASASAARSVISAASTSDVTDAIAASGTVVAAINSALDDAGIVHSDSILGDPTLSFAITDETSHRSDLELGLDGKLTARVVQSIGERFTPAVPEIASDGRIFLAKTDGTRTLLGTISGASSPTLLNNAAVRVETSSGPKWVSTTYSTARPVFPTSNIACWGDSLTYSTNPGNVQASPTYPQTVATDLGVTVYNGGIGGNCSADIATRQGGLQPLCTLTGNQIPSGSTTAIVLTAISPTTGWRTTANTSFHGTLAGVAGTLTNNVSGSNFTFTPDSAPGSTVAVAAGTPFYGDEGAALRDRINVIWSGHNNAPQATAVADVSRDVASMVAWLTPYTKRYLVLSATWESKFVNDQINAPLAATYGDLYVDLNDWLITDGLTECGLTPTSNDLADIAAGEVPRQLRHDGTHFTQVCTTAIGHYIADQITARNWV